MELLEIKEEIIDSMRRRAEARLLVAVNGPYKDGYVDTIESMLSEYDKIDNIFKEKDKKIQVSEEELLDVFKTL